MDDWAFKINHLSIYPGSLYFIFSKTSPNKECEMSGIVKKRLLTCDYRWMNCVFHWCHRNGWLGVKIQLYTYLPTYLTTYLPTYQPTIKLRVMINSIKLHSFVPVLVTFHDDNRYGALPYRTRLNDRDPFSRSWKSVFKEKKLGSIAVSEIETHQRLKMNGF